MPAPFTSLPCWYNLRTDGPMPCASTILDNVRPFGSGARQLIAAPLSTRLASDGTVTGKVQTFGAFSTTLMSFRKSTPSFCRTPSRKPCDSPSVAPGFIAANSRGYSFACSKAADSCRAVWVASNYMRTHR